MVATLIKINKAKLLGKIKTQSLFLAPNCFLSWYKLSFSRAVFENNIAFSYSQIFSSFWARQGKNQPTVSRDLGTPAFLITTFRSFCARQDFSLDRESCWNTLKLGIVHCSCTVQYRSFIYTPRNCLHCQCHPDLVSVCFPASERCITWHRQSSRTGLQRQNAWQNTILL